MNNNFLDFLRTRLSSKLPGFKSHIKMAPTLKNTIYRNFTPPINSRTSAVLLLFSMDFSKKLQLLFTLRSNKLNSHSGQISFPGGKTDKGETPIQTALRETYEEVGISKDSISIIGGLSNLYVPHSLSNITPIVGFAKEKYYMEINKDEVAEAFHIDFNEFLVERNYRKEIWNYDGKKLLVPFWDVHHSTPLWGATAIILQELIDLYNEFESVDNI